MVRKENSELQLKKINQLERKIENLEEMVRILKEVNEVDILKMGGILGDFMNHREFLRRWSFNQTDLDERIELLERLLSQILYPIEEICGLKQILRDDFEERFKLKEENDQLSAKLENLEQEITELKEKQSRLQQQLAQLESNQPEPREKIIIREDTDLIEKYQKLEQELTTVKEQKQNERYFFITALAIGLTVMSGLVIKLKRLRKKIGN